ncbi:MAG TPA: ATP-binding protein [Hyphomicrobiaceae bacterium]|nr:ATP-binding protein [Hyphomicrobiaceae bacterium]
MRSSAPGHENDASTETGWPARFRARVPGVVLAALLFALFTVFGGLPWAWAAFGCLSAVLYAAFWPAARVQLTVVRPVAHPGDLEKAWPAILAGIPEAALLLDREWKVLGVNPPAQRSLGVSVGQVLTEVLRAPEIITSVQQTLATGEQQICDTRLPGPEERHFRCFATPLASGLAGNPALMLVLQDLTEGDRLARMRSDFVANASHELRTPLASLKGFVETLRGAAKDDPAARERFLGIMQEQADRMALLIDDLLSLSRIETRQHLRPEGSVDLPEIAARAAGDLSRNAAAAQIALNVHRPASRAIVRGDRDELYQLVHNLIENAIKYGRPGGKVDVTFAVEGSRIAMAVEDDGIGIAPEHLPRLTERFYRVSAKASRERGGTGLGLAIVKHIVTRHQGDFEIRSGPDKGSVFTVRLPAILPASESGRE